MSYQKQKAFKLSTSQDMSEGSFIEQQLIAQKKKRIQKQLDKDIEDKEELCSAVNRNKKQVAKQIKRIRQQNRRANHKQYVTSLQLEIKNKEVEIQKLSSKIKQLQLQLQSKICHKCGSQVTQVNTCSPLSILQEPPIEAISEMQQISEDSFRRVTDESSLRICFGNKNLLFFFVTMCCLTIGSIADNPQIFLEPIVPYKVKSQMCYLSSSYKLDKFKYGSNFKNYYENKQINLDIFKNWNEQSEMPRLEEKITRPSDLFNFNLSWSKIITKIILNFSSLKNPQKILLGCFGTNNILHRLMVGRNYYI